MRSESILHSDACRTVRPHRRFCSTLTGLIATLIVVCVAPRVQAHPLGNFSINHYSRLELSRDTIRIHYIVDMAEIPAFQERSRMDADGDGSVSDRERETYTEAMSRTMRQGLALEINGLERNPMPVSSRLRMPRGQAGLSTLRLHLVLESPLSDPQNGDTWQVIYRDDNHANRLGWKEIIVRAAPDVRLLRSDVPRRDLSDALRNYPDNRLADPPDVRQADLMFDSNPVPAAAEEPVRSDAAARSKPQNRLAVLVTAEKMTLPAMLLALISAAILGAFHALAPGHGKALVGAYLVGARGTARHALILGLTVTATHTAGVFALGLITLGASHYLLPEQIYPWLAMASGAIVVAMGAGLLKQRLQSRADEGYHGHHHPHEHPYHHGHTHSHPHAIEGDSHGHAQDRPKLRNLLALGVSGGLLPCPSALVVLLGAIAIQRTGFGLLLIAAFSAGLAAVLTVVGLLFVSARNLFLHSSRNRAVLKYMPIGSALIITMAGIGISIRGVWQIL